MARLAVAVIVAGLCLVSRARGEDGDGLDRIPRGALDGPEPAGAPPAHARELAGGATAPGGRVFVADAFTGASPAQAAPVPYPRALVHWQDRLSLDASGRWAPGGALELTFSDRLNVFEQSDLPALSSQTVQNDLREAYVAWEARPSTFLEAGRVNVRSGVALGFNPTDYFKTRTLVGQASLDPSVIRENRLGTLMVRAQTLWKGGSASLAFAPRVGGAAPLASRSRLGVNPRLDTTNADDRVLATLSLDVADLAPQLSGYVDPYRAKLGLGVSQPIGGAVVGYAEWSGGPERTLAARAVAFGRATGELPGGAPVLPPTSGARSFTNDVAAGFSWTVATAATLNVEYHLHEAGFGRRDWRRWFDAGSAPGAPSGVPGELWYVRGYANDQQEPVSTHQLFLRAAWPRALGLPLELGGFAFVSLLDGSALTQLSATYHLSDGWTVALYGSANVGGRRTEHGSFPQRLGAIVELTWFR
jgi:hypothetical protein